MNTAKRQLLSYNPSTEQIIWSEAQTDESSLEHIVETAQVAQKKWEACGLEARKEILRAFGRVVEKHAEETARVISEDNGKPFWEAKTEVQALIDKVEASIAAFDERALTRTIDGTGRQLVTRFRPHGVMAVIGPFNFPMHMPNCHVMPALLAGNAVIFKPSSRTPKAGEYYVRLWHEAGVPQEVLQMVVGGVGDALVGQSGINGVLFVGSRKVGLHIEKKLAEETGKIRALEMGGNGPLIVWDYDDVKAAAFIVAQSAYISSGQRCSATRRAIVNSAIADEFMAALKNLTENIVVGDAFNKDPEPFMGPLVDQKAVAEFLSDYDTLLAQGAKALVPVEKMVWLGSNFVRPGIVDVTGIKVEDKEIFGPLLQLVRVDSFEAAIAEANNTQYGLTAGIITQSSDRYEEFFYATNAGIVNWNQPTTGAPVDIPFGGVKGSGNHRPSGYLAVDYCSYACASSESSTLTLPEVLPPGLNL